MSFTAVRQVPVGVGPAALVTRDFNGDGHLDLAVANNFSSDVSILFGDGADGFAPATNYAVGMRPVAISAGDFNGDGKADLVTTNSDSANISVLLGTGGGAFGGATNYAMNEDPHGLAVGDFNGDSLSDIAVGSARGSNKVSILLSNGAGGFNAALAIAAGGRVYTIILGKFNGDAILDLAVRLDNQSAVFMGNGSGGFSAAASLPAGFGVMATGDFNGDSQADLVGANGYSNGISVLLGDGAGGFSAPATFPGNANGGIVVSDFNGDGKSDVAALDGSAGSVLILSGDGTGQLSALTRYNVGGEPTGAVSADFNADGKLDLAVTSRADAVTLLYGTTGGEFVGSHNFKVGFTPDRIVRADFNRDGKDDLAVVNGDASGGGQFGTTDISILLGDGAGRMVSAPSIKFTSWESLTSLVTADFNNDGKADLAVSAAGSFTAEVNVMLGNGDGTFAAPIETALRAYGITPYQLTTADFNRDGIMDIVAPSRSSGNIVTLLGSGDGNFSIVPGNKFTGSNNIESFAVGDFNHDADPDLVFVNYHDKMLSVLLNYGKGDFNAKLEFPLAFSPVALVVGDFNRDGKDDVAFTGMSNGNYYVTVRLAQGAGNFAAGTEYRIVNGAAGSIITGDFNGDNLIDLALSGSNITVLAGDGVSVLTGDGAGSFGLPVHLAGVEGDLAAGDFNRDGKTDLAVSRYNASSVAILLNDFSAPRPCLSVDDVAFTEGDAGASNATFTVTLSEASAQAVRVNYRVVPRPTFNFELMDRISPTPGIDFQPVSGTLTFAPGTTTQTINVPVNGDLADEYDEEFSVFLSSPVNAMSHDMLGIGTILDNDAPPTITIDDRTVVEGGFSSDPNRAIFIVALSAVSGKLIKLQYRSAGNTASEASDYIPLSGTLTFRPGTTTQTINVYSSGDTTYEPDETFFVNLSDALDATITDAQGQGTIINDDPLPTISAPASPFSREGNAGTTEINATVLLSNPSYQTITLNYSTADGSAIAGSDYVAASGSLTFNPGEVSKTVKLFVLGDVIDEIDETFNITLSGAANATMGTAQSVIRIGDDDGPNITINDISVLEGDSGTKSATFTLTLSAVSPQSIQVLYRTTDGTATGNSDYFSVSNSSVSIPAGELSATFTIFIRGDLLIEPDETVNVNLHSPTGGTITDPLGVCTILNNDAAGSLQFDAASYSVNENSTAATISVNRVGGRSGVVSATFSTADGTATAGSDYTAVNQSVTFANGDDAGKTITIPLTDDSLVEAAETINLILSNPTNGAISGSPFAAVLTIVDNDLTCTYAISPPGKTSPAAGETTTVNVTAQDGCTWTAVSNSNFINVASGASGAGVGMVTLTVSANSSGVPRTGTVTIAGQTFTVTQPEQVPEVPTYQFGAASYAIGEGDERVSVTVTRRGASTGTTSVDYRTVDADTFTASCADTTNNNGGAFARCDFATSVGRLEFAAGETQKTITVPIINDGHAEGAETFQIALLNPVGAAILGATSTTTVTMQDDDSAGSVNPIFATPFFVRQHYLDFLSREPEMNEPWSNVLNRCPNVNNDPLCDRILVSQSFFGSPEFRLKGFYVFRFYKLAFNRLPDYTEIVEDMSFVAGATPEEVYARRAQLAAAFTQRPEFQTAYGGLSNAMYVTTLFGRYGINGINTPDPQRPDDGAKTALTAADLISRLDANALTRGQVLRAIADSDEVGAREFDNAFVAMQYYGYLRRKPEAAGYEAWLDVLRRGDTRTMVDGFMNSTEYKLRFGRP